MSDFDPLDQRIRQVLHGNVDGQPPADPASQLTALRPRFRRARRRRTTAAAASVAAAIVVVVVGVSTTTDSQVHVITPAHSTSKPTTALPATTTTVIVVAPPTTVPGVTPPPASTVPTNPTSTSIGSGHSPGGAPSPPTSTLVQPAPPASTTTTVATQSRTLTAPGGTVVVRYDSTVHIFSVTPTAGWTVSETKQDDPTRIEVRFTRDGSSDQSRVEARLQHGQLETTTS